MIVVQRLSGVGDPADTVCDQIPGCCGTGYELLVDGSCTPQCPADQERQADLTCRAPAGGGGTPCPEGQTRQTDGTCRAAEPSGIPSWAIYGSLGLLGVGVGLVALLAGGKK